MRGTPPSNALVKYLSVVRGGRGVAFSNVFVLAMDCHGLGWPLLIKPSSRDAHANGQSVPSPFDYLGRPHAHDW